MVFSSGSKASLVAGDVELCVESNMYISAEVGGVAGASNGEAYRRLEIDYTALYSLISDVRGAKRSGVK